MLPETIHELARRHRNIVGQKESTGNVEQSCALVSATAARRVLAVVRATTISICRRWPWARYGMHQRRRARRRPRIRAMTDAFDHGDIAAAGAHSSRIAALFTALFTITSPIPIKWAVNRLGFAAGPCRSPLGAMPESLARTLEPLIAPYLRVPA